MKPGYSLWIKDESGQRVFGEGPYQLLLLVDELGSLNKASIEMSMSYSKTINIIKKCETSLNIKLLEREIGGSDGGGSKLTKAGRDLVEKYGRFKEISARTIEKSYNETFREF
ncbi:MAG: LysR family transcriptional regulator [Tissierellia bacterium]|jgi:molybdate transport system regulatory protein|nr:LysR family transcriptional regulator [Tissierellia bacterium]